VPAGGFISPVGGTSIVDLAGLVANPDSVATAAAAGAIPQGATFGVGQIRSGGLNFGLMIRALRTDGESNVIAQPQLLALDNDEAVFQDGQQVPFLAGTTTSLGGGGGTGGGLNLVPTQNINREDIGTKLTITPQINDGGAMTLDIQLESSELSGSTGDGGSAITNKRSFDTKVRVDDGQTIVLAGMIRDFKRSNETRVPFLGRIPLIGELFKTRSGERQQKMLMVFIRPTILIDSLQTSAHTQNKYNLMREQGIRQGERNELLPILPFTGNPELPELQQPVVPAPQAPPPDNGASTSPVP
jgi:general secretion pathway protein D